MIALNMGYLRPVPSEPPVMSPDGGCLEAFDRELSYLFQTLHRLGASPREVEDLAQDVFMVLYKNWPTLDTSRPLRPYLFGVAFRLVAAHRRRRFRDMPHAPVDMEDGALGPEASLQAKESSALLLAALDHLPLRRRAVLIMHDLDSVPVADIARKLSISRFGTYARLRKARTELAAAVRRLSKGAAPK
jgi:RNA polymerase sigma-70 factor (ECF subfamily)